MMRTVHARAATVAVLIPVLLTEIRRRNDSRRRAADSGDDPDDRRRSQRATRVHRNVHRLGIPRCASGSFSDQLVSFNPYGTGLSSTEPMCATTVTR